MTKTKKSVITKEEFELLPINEQKVMVAKDVLANLKAKQYVADTGRYIDLDTIKGGIDYRKDVQQQFHQIQECHVCALGACLLSATKFKNRLTFDDVNIWVLRSDYNFRNQKAFGLLAEIFPPEELLLIEHCFEGYSKRGDRVGRTVFNVSDDSEMEEIANKFNSKYKTDLGRMRGIMKNIIKNNGQFKP